MMLHYLALILSTGLNLYLVFSQENSFKERRKNSILKFNKDNNLAEYDPVIKKWVCKSLPIGYCDQDGNIFYVDNDVFKIINGNTFNKKIISEHIPVFANYI